MKRFLFPILSVFAAIATTSCFQSETTLRLKKDGSGTLTEETSFGAQAVEMLAQFAQLGGGGADPLAELASETKAKKRAAELGEGVTVEKAEAIGENGSKGGRVTYHFTDINKLKFSPDSAAKSALPNMPGAPPMPVKESAPMVFNYAGDKLVIQVPEPEKAEAPAGEAAELPAGELGAEEEAAMKQMLADLKISFKIVIEAGIAETNATHVEGNAITISEMEFGKMMEKPGALKKLSQMGRGNPGAAIDEMKKLDGVKIETKRELTVTLK